MKIFYRRNLPHIILPHSIYFITFRLHNSLPQSKIIQLKEEYNEQCKPFINRHNIPQANDKLIQIAEDYFYNFDEILHNCGDGPVWLRIDSIAKIVADALHFRDKKVYDLFAYTIMSNHVHIIIRPITDTENNLIYNLENENKLGRSKCDYLLGIILESLKRFTAHKANKELGRTGNFWQHENYDHMIRNYDELITKTEYILNNPVKAGLVDSPEKWQWNYYNVDLL
jgi:putative transposase